MARSTIFHSRGDSSAIWEMSEHVDFMMENSQNDLVADLWIVLLRLWEGVTTLKNAMAARQQITWRLTIGNPVPGIAYSLKKKECTRGDGGRCGLAALVRCAGERRAPLEKALVGSILEASLIAAL